MKKIILSITFAVAAYSIQAQTPTPMSSGQYNYTHANYKATVGKPLGVINGTTGQFGAIQSVDTIWVSGDSIKFKIAGVTYGTLSQNIWKYGQLNNTIYSNKNDSTSLLFGADTISMAGNTGVYFNKTKFAFRSGQGIWVYDSLGLGSTAMGSYTTASGYYSTAMGGYATASGSPSTAIGYYATASGDGSTAIGSNTTASGDGSTAMGDSTTASGDYSTAMGQFITASGDGSTAMGHHTTASGLVSTAMGYETTASGDNSTAMGNGTTSNGYASLVVGLFNDTLVGAETYFSDTTPLFIVGNGTSSSDLHNAFVIRNNGTVEIDSLPSGGAGDSIVTVGSGKILQKRSVQDVFNYTYPVLTFATLPVSPSVGTIRFISDADTPTWHAPAVGGGSDFTGVYWDGSDWICF